MNKSIIVHLNKKNIERFWAKVDICNEDECWNWKAYKDKGGYGTYRMNDKMFLSHRVTWTLFNNNDIRDNLHVLHKCDNPACCNPKHLFVGTHADNMRDCEEKGRNYIPKGVKNGNAKLTREQVLAIRSRYVPHVVSTRMLADEFGVNRVTISYIINRKTWKHI